MSWVDDLKKEYSYCSHIRMEPFPSVTPEFFTGYRILCGKDCTDINPAKCEACSERRDDNERSK